MDGETIEGADDGVTIRSASPAEVHALVEALADVLVDCVEGGASVGFLWPLPRARAIAFWRGVADSVVRGERVLLVAEGAQRRLLGTVQIVLALPDNQPHRADVAKMLVHRRARRRGIAQRLMSEVDVVARGHGRSVLVLDAVTGGDAERLYGRMGWQRAGVVPKFALMPGGEFCATTYMYKHLPETPTRTG